jgi:hypothetical protein
MRAAVTVEAGCRSGGRRHQLSESGLLPRLYQTSRNFSLQPDRRGSDRASPALSYRLARVVFTEARQSAWGWAFIARIDGGRKEYADDGNELTRIFRHELAACTYEVLPGPGRRLRWGVPVSRGHDDLLISAALASRLDALDW